MDAASGALLAEAGGGDDEGVWLGEWRAIVQAIGDVDFCAFVEVAGDFVRGVAVRAIAVQIRQGADVAVVFVAPADEARVAAGEGLYFFEGCFFHRCLRLSVLSCEWQGGLLPPACRDILESFLDLFLEVDFRIVAVFSRYGDRNSAGSVLVSAVRTFPELCQLESVSLKYGN